MYESDMQKVKSELKKNLKQLVMNPKAVPRFPGITYEQELADCA